MLFCQFVVVHVVLVYRGRFFFQAEDGIRDLVRSRGLGDVYKRQRVQFNARAAHPHDALTIYRRFAFGSFLDLFMIENLSLIHI